MQIYNFSSI